jgi:hypothetical protein
MIAKEESISPGTKLAMLAGALFMVACFKSCEDLCYRWSGKQTTATVSNIAEQHSRGGTTGYNIWYAFQNENTRKNVKGSTLVGAGEVHQYSVGQQVDIEYYGGDMFTSRIKGSGSVFWPIFFWATLAASIVGIVVMTVRANREQRKPPRKSSR